MITPQPIRPQKRVTAILNFYAPGMESGASSFCPVCLFVAKKLLTLAITFERKHGKR